MLVACHYLLWRCGQWQETLPIMSSTTRAWHPATQSYQPCTPEIQLRNEVDTEPCMGETNVIAANIVYFLKEVMPTSGD